MRRRRAFTLIELVIVMTILAIVLGPLLLMVQGIYREYSRLALEVDLKAEAEAAAYKVFRLAVSTPGYRLDPDNHGLRSDEGWRVGLEDGRLLVRGKPGPRVLTQRRVLDFSAVRREGRLILTLVLEAPGRTGYRAVHVWPPVRGAS